MHLKNAPIKEAILQILISPISNVEVFKDISTLSSYKQSEAMFNNTLTIERSSDGLTEKRENNIIGYKYSSEEGRFIAQLRNDGVVVSMLEPYSNWEEFKTESIKIWESYKAVCKSKFTFVRFSLRYINVLPLPFINGQLDYDEYLETAPKVPKELGNVLSEFVTSLAVPLEDGSLAMISQSSQPPQIAKDTLLPVDLPVILDIDVLRNNVSSFSEDQMWSLFDKLRDYKNKAFRSSITDKAMELFG